MPAEFVKAALSLEALDREFRHALAADLQLQIPRLTGRMRALGPR